MPLCFSKIQPKSLIAQATLTSNRPNHSYGINRQQYQHTCKFTNCWI